LIQGEYKVSDTIISFTTIEYPNQEIMDKSHEIFEKEMALLADKLRPQGMIRFHSSRLFLPEGKLMMGNWLEYKDMTAYEDCNKIWEKNGEEFFEKYGEIMAEVKITAYRGQVALDWS
jgi:hypothetical protein